VDCSLRLGQRAVPRRFAERDLVMEVRANRMPDGGIVTTFTDITPSVKAADSSNGPTNR
jgi:hypothetical protein